MERTGKRISLGINLLEILEASMELGWQPPVCQVASKVHVILTQKEFNTILNELEPHKERIFARLSDCKTGKIINIFVSDILQPTPVNLPTLKPSLLVPDRQTDKQNVSVSSQQSPLTPTSFNMSKEHI